MEPVHDLQRLRELQALLLDRKIQISQARIIEWYTRNKGNVVVSFSGGKDSTVLLHLVRSLFPDVKAVFSNTGLEYPEIQRFVRTFPNVTIVAPKMNFSEVISTYGYPLIGKEVSEAIYYARRICSQTVNVERERDRTVRRKQCELQGLRDDSLGGAERESVSENSSTENESTPANDVQTPGTPRRKNTLIQTGNAKFRRTTLVGKARKTGVTQKDCQGGVFDEEDGKKSLFNKEKWLPLVYTPIPISNYCCTIMKKQPISKYHHANHVVPYLGTLAEESRMRTQAWIRTGCNAFNTQKPTSQPMAFWTEQDVLQYIVDYGLKIAPVYGDIICTDKDGNEYIPNGLTTGCKLQCSGCNRTGCIFCAFGAHLEKGETRFQRLAKTHPRQYEYCMDGGQWADNPAYDPAAPEYDGEWKNWNPEKIWVPSKKGLGMKVVFDMVNEIYGKNFYRYD